MPAVRGTNTWHSGPPRAIANTKILAGIYSTRQLARYAPSHAQGSFLLLQLRIQFSAIKEHAALILFSLIPFHLFEPAQHDIDPSPGSFVVRISGDYQPSIRRNVIAVPTPLVFEQHDRFPEVERAFW